MVDVQRIEIFEECKSVFSMALCKFNEVQKMVTYHATHAHRSNFKPFFVQGHGTKKSAGVRYDSIVHRDENCSINDMPKLLPWVHRVCVLLLSAHCGGKWHGTDQTV